jgi:hypothetical protein
MIVSGRTRSEIPPVRLKTLECRAFFRAATERKRAYRFTIEAEEVALSSIT